MIKNKILGFLLLAVCLTVLLTVSIGTVWAAEGDTAVDGQTEEQTEDTGVEAQADGATTVYLAPDWHTKYTDTSKPISELYINGTLPEGAQLYSTGTGYVRYNRTNYSGTVVSGTGSSSTVKLFVFPVDPKRPNVGPYVGYVVDVKNVSGKIGYSPDDLDAEGGGLSFPKTATVMDLTNLDTSNVRSFKHLFDYHTQLVSLDVSTWDTSNVTTMYEMFRSVCVLPELDVSRWDVSNVTNMQGLFIGTNALTSLDLSRWDTSKVTTMYQMFSGSYSLTSLDIADWDVSNVTSMYSMFSGVPIASLDLSSWDVSSVVNMSYMFSHCNYLTWLDLSGWDLSSVKNMSYMFYYHTDDRFLWGDIPLLSLDLSGWDMSGVTSYTNMFNCIQTNEKGWIRPIGTIYFPAAVPAENAIRIGDGTRIVYVEGDTARPQTYLRAATEGEDSAHTKYGISYYDETGGQLKTQSAIHGLPVELYTAEKEGYMLAGYTDADGTMYRVGETPAIASVLPTLELTAVWKEIVHEEEKPVYGVLDTDGDGIPDIQDTDPTETPTIAIDVYWTDMVFNYTQSWDEVNLTYVWSWQNGEDYIRVDNRSSVDVDVSVSFTGNGDYTNDAVDFVFDSETAIAGSWDGSKLTLGYGNQATEDQLAEDPEAVVAPTGTLNVNVAEATTMATGDGAAAQVTLGQITVNVTVAEPAAVEIALTETDYESHDYDNPKVVNVTVGKTYTITCAPVGDVTITDVLLEPTAIREGMTCETTTDTCTLTFDETLVGEEITLRLWATKSDDSGSYIVYFTFVVVAE